MFAPKVPYNNLINYFEFKPGSIKFHSIPYSSNFMKFLIDIPSIFNKFNKELKKADIISSSSNAYPPLGIMANIFCYIKKYKNTIFIMDADFINDLELKINSEKNLIKKFTLTILKKFYLINYNFCIDNSMITFVVGDAIFERYNKKENIFKVYASWTKADDIITVAELENKLDKRDVYNFRICFVGTLKYTKNPSVAIKMVKILKNRNIPIKLDIFGNGPLKSELIKIVRDNNLSKQVRFKKFVPYGPAFYRVLREYDAIIIPNLSGEQPRIIFDAWANGTAIIGSKIKSFSIISNNFDGILCDPIKPNCFANAVEKLYFREDLLKTLVYNGLKKVKKNTIESMHRNRIKIIEKNLNKN